MRGQAYSPQRVKAAVADYLHGVAPTGRATKNGERLLSDSNDQADTATAENPQTERRCRVRQYAMPDKYLPRKPRSRELINPTVRQQISACCVGESDWPCVLVGQQGSGKTCALLALCDHYGGQYVTFADWCSLVARSQTQALWAYGVWAMLSPWILQPRGDTREYAQDHVVYPERLWGQYWAERNLICLDELGTRTPTEPQREVLQRCLDGREGKPLVCATNLPLNELGQVYDDRIVSRLMAGTVVQMPDEDRRIENGP